ncbi:MAG: T9SS type A sorting domain-containing protein, partial [Bacteroidales bacterium]|nr:T9SS type A sorting domain-containing protein [Bacteroidales bacterium]
TTDTITRDVWTHITATFDETTMKIYINGDLSTSESAGFSTIVVPTGDVHIGKWQSKATLWEKPFKGAIDEVKIFSEALTSSEVKDLYNDVPLSVEEVSNTFSARCYPNPFSSSITIDYNVPVNGKVMVEIYNLYGQLIKRLVDENQSSAGKHSAEWNASNLADGLYLCKIVINGNIKMYRILKK